MCHYCKGVAGMAGVQTKQLGLYYQKMAVGSLCLCAGAPEWRGSELHKVLSTCAQKIRALWGVSSVAGLEKTSLRFWCLDLLCDHVTPLSLPQFLLLYYRIIVLLIHLESTLKSPGENALPSFDDKGHYRPDFSSHSQLPFGSTNQYHNLSLEKPLKP